ncbi:hypothetical protein BX616_011020 [Lobosporangium transversale]|uniref:F-box domain-containing protein n=1 Tax=Lobosporangium transversale TaxID=64571 RepID=A0A1Y2H385_9FUNG|nr:hypothetical protein BCR41DRAFT_9787 [Lobosporangium transversale]KAF9917881.1 hypothetical protein BX616_011020 [Lobosporangium transversale]ORZ29007.1 hypothetical protein BCR41DRAFT_9787 [Lobosporangium transversale]|eukprot:XP_021886680.1 hypothetical protein BCR41DRAFT_9787 [Lobosporangium transversale]
MPKQNKVPNEIFFQIGQLLDLRNLAQCALVSRAWNAVFSPMIWSNIALGPSSRIIENITQERIANKAHHVKHLILEGDSSPQQFEFIIQCFHLQTISFHRTTPYYYDSNDNGKRETRRQCFKPWKISCRQIFKQNRRTLRSLKLHDCVLPTGEYCGQRSTWSPFLSLVRFSRSVLTTLRLVNSIIPPGPHLEAFWTICEQLEILELREVHFEMTSVPKAERAAMALAEGYHNNLGRRHQVVRRRFPCLKELTLWRSGPYNPLAQLEQIIRCAPRLKSLIWRCTRQSWFPYYRFIYLITGDVGYYRQPTPKQRLHCIPLEPCAGPCWPDLGSLTITDLWFSSYFKPVDCVPIIRAMKRLHKLDVPLEHMSCDMFIHMFTQHSLTITDIDWRRADMDMIPGWFDTIMSCPNLKRFAVNNIHAYDLIQPHKEWKFLHRLEEFMAPISIDPSGYNPPRTRPLTEAEIDEQYSLIFSLLAKMRALKVLDVSPGNTQIYCARWHLLTLPLKLDKGLRQLSELKNLECFRFKGPQNMGREEVYWIIQNWKMLQTLEGGLLARNRSRYIERPNVWDCALAQILNRHRISTPNSIYHPNYIRKNGGVDWSEPCDHDYFKGDSMIEPDINTLDLDLFN